MIKRTIRKPMILVITAILMISSLGGGLSFAQDFADVKGHWAEEDIKYMEEKGIINGLNKDGEVIFIPDNLLTRAEFIKMIVLEKDLEIEKYDKSSFSDVEPTHWALDYIETARKNGIIQGYEDNTFKPDEHIKRSEMVAIVVKAYELEAGEKEMALNFVDVDEKHWAYKYIKIAAENELIKGIYIDGKYYFKPADYATRGQSVVLLANHERKMDELLAMKENIKSKKSRKARDGSSGSSSGGSSGGSSKIDLTLNGGNTKLQEIIAQMEDEFNQNPQLDSSVKLSGIQLKNFSGSEDDVEFKPLNPEETSSLFGTKSDATGNMSRTLPGLTGSVFEFSTNGKSFTTGDITLDTEEVTDSEIDNLQAVYYNESNYSLEFLPTSIDTENNTITFSTTHNSKYLLIDITKWEDTWRRELTVAESVYNGEYTDFTFIIDSSGSMSNNDPKDLRKEAVVDMTNAFNFDLNSEMKLESVTVASSVYESDYYSELIKTTVTNSVYSESDRAAVIDFDSDTEVLCTFSADAETVADSVYFIDSSGGTDIFSGIQEATVINEVYGKDSQNRIAVLLTDGQNNYTPEENHWQMVRDAAEQGIRIMTMGLGDGVNNELLTDIAQMTGAQYYKISTAEEIESKFALIKEYSSLNDTDGDGISDIDEITGLRLKNGMVVLTDPNNADTDGDGISDGVELGDVIEIIVTEDMARVGSDLIGKKVKAYDFISFPDDINSIPSDN